MSDSKYNDLRSARWFAPHDLTGFVHRTAIQAEGFSRFAIKDRPVIGIANSWSGWSTATSTSSCLPRP